MGAPAVVAGAALKTRTGRRLLVGILVVLAVVNFFLLTPLSAIPFAVAGQAASSVSSGHIGASAGPMVQGDWGYPLAGAYTKGRGFGPNPVHGCSYCTEFHPGYDMSQACGATIYAAGPGVVVTAGQFQGYGNAVRIDHGGGLQTLYGHMAWRSLRVSVGQHVTAGTPLGAEGDTGHSFGCHLHFEIRLRGTPIDPEPFMAARGLPLK